MVKGIFCFAVGFGIYAVLGMLALGVATVLWPGYNWYGQGVVVIGIPAMVVAGLSTVLLSKRLTDVPRRVMIGFPIVLFVALVAVLVAEDTMGW